MYLQTQAVRDAIDALSHIPYTFNPDLPDPRASLEGTIDKNQLIFKATDGYEIGFYSIEIKKSSKDKQDRFNVVFDEFRDAIAAIQSDGFDLLIDNDGALTLKAGKHSLWVDPSTNLLPPLPVPPQPHLTVCSTELIEALSDVDGDGVTAWLYVKDEKLHIATLEQSRSIRLLDFTPDPADPYTIVSVPHLLRALIPHAHSVNTRLYIHHTSERLPNPYLAIQSEADHFVQGLAGVRLEGRVPPHHLQEKKKRHLQPVPDLPPQAPPPEPEMPLFAVEARTAIDNYLENIDRLRDTGDDALLLNELKTLTDSLSKLLPGDISQPVQPKAIAKKGKKKPQAAASKKPVSKPKTAIAKTVTSTGDKDRWAVLADKQMIVELKADVGASEAARRLQAAGRQIGSTTICQIDTTYSKLYLKSAVLQKLYEEGKITWSDLYAMSRNINKWGIPKIEQFLTEKARKKA